MTQRFRRELEGGGQESRPAWNLSVSAQIWTCARRAGEELAVKFHFAESDQKGRNAPPLSALQRRLPTFKVTSSKPLYIMSSKQFNIGPAYGLSAEVKNKIALKYDPQKEEELRVWIEGITGKQIGDNFQKGLKDGVILCELINKIRPNSVKKINHSALNWHQLENLSNFIKAMQNYGIKPHDTFEANDLFENGNLTQVQTALLALAGMAKTKGMNAGVDIGVKYADKQQRSFNQETLNAGQCVIGLQMGTNKCASQTGMSAYGTRRHLYDPRSQMPASMDQSTISLQMGTNKGASQAGMTAPGTRRPIYDKKLGTEQCDSSTASLQMGSNQGATQSGTNFGLGRQIYNPKYCPNARPGLNGSNLDYNTEHGPENPADLS